MSSPFLNGQRGDSYETFTADKCCEVKTGHGVAGSFEVLSKSYWQLIKIDIHDFFFLLRHIVSSLADEEPEEDVSVEQLEEKAIGGDARAQARVSESTCTDMHRQALGIVFSPAS